MKPTTCPAGHTWAGPYEWERVSLPCPWPNCPHGVRSDRYMTEEFPPLDPERFLRNEAPRGGEEVVTLRTEWIRYRLPDGSVWWWGPAPSPGAPGGETNGSNGGK